MLNAIYEAATERTKDQYKVIEAKYVILKRYLKEFFDHHYQMSAADVDLILKTLDPPNIECVESEEELSELNDDSDE